MITVTTESIQASACIGVGYGESKFLPVYFFANFNSIMGKCPLSNNHLMGGNLVHLYTVQPAILAPLPQVQMMSISSYSKVAWAFGFF